MVRLVQTYAPLKRILERVAGKWFGWFALVRMLVQIVMRIKQRLAVLLTTDVVDLYSKISNCYKHGMHRYHFLTE